MHAANLICPPREFDTIFNDARKRIKDSLGNTGSSHNRMLYIQSFLEEISESPVINALRMYNIYWNTLLNEMQLYPYVIPLMTELRKRGLLIAVMTDLTAHIQHRKTLKLGLAEYINILVTSEEVGEEKPSHKAFDILIKKALLSPSEMLMIGDSVEKDIKGANEAGLRSLLFSPELQDSMNKKCLEFIC